jgi:hypothetical protein
MEFYLGDGWNFGVFPAPGSPVVIADVDDMNGFKKLGAIVDLPQTFCTETGSSTPERRKIHAYYECPGYMGKLELRDPTRKGDDGKPIHLGEIYAQSPDAAKGYVIGPGSIHPCGNKYTIARDVPLTRITREQLQASLQKLEVTSSEAERVKPPRTVSAGSITDELNLRVEDFLSPGESVRRGDSVQGSHPIHGSEGGMNFAVNTVRNKWYCFRCGSGGGPLEALAVAEGIISCDQAGPGCLDGHWPAVFDALRQRGYTVTQDLQGQPPTKIPDECTRPGDLPAIPRVNLELRCTLPAGHFIGDYVEYWGTRTDAYPELHHLSAVALISIAIDRKVICPLSFATIYPNMWVFALGQSGVARKSTALSKMRYLAGAEFPEKALPGSFSTESLFEKLADCPRSYLIKDEAGSFLQGINRKTYLADLRDVFAELFECETVRRTLRTSKKKDRSDFLIADPYLTFAWATTPENFQGAATPIDVKSGFLARFLYYYPRYEKPTFGVGLATGGMTSGLATIGNRYHTIIKALDQFFEIVAVPSDYSLDLYNAWYITKQKEITRRYSVEGSVFSRMTTAVFKLAMIYYVGSAEFLDDVKVHISTTRPFNAHKRPGDQRELITARFTIPDVYFDEALRNVREYFLPVAASIVSEIDGMASGNVQKQILQFLRDEGGRATKNAILRKMRMKAKDLTDHLDTLEEGESIKVELVGEKDAPKKTVYVTLLEV